MYGTGKFSVRAVNASDPEKNSLSVTINPAFLDKTGISDAVRAGAPAGKYTSYAIGEAGMCIMRNHASKLSTESDTKYTTYMD